MKNADAEKYIIKPINTMNLSAVEIGRAHEGKIKQVPIQTR